MERPPSRLASVHRVAVGVALLGLGAVLSPAAAQPVPEDPEVAIDVPAQAHSCPRVAARDDGSFAAFWWRQDAPYVGTVWVRAVDAEGRPGPRVQLDADSAYPEDIEARPGGYTALWRKSFYDEATNTIRYPHLTAPLDAEARPQVDTTDLMRGGVSMAARPGGGLVAAWSAGRTLFVQLLDGTGAALHLPVKIRNADAFEPVVVGRSNGEFALIWHALTGSPKYLDRGIVMQRFGAGGGAVGKVVTLLAAHREEYRESFRAAMGEDGTVAVVDLYSSRATGFSRRAALHTFGPAGGRIADWPLPLGEHGFLNSIPSGLAVDPAGRVLLAWTEYTVQRPSVARARQLSRQLEPEGEAFDLASLRAGEHDFTYCPEVGWAAGSWVFAWMGSRQGGTPEQTTNLYVRRFVAP